MIAELKKKTCVVITREQAYVFQCAGVRCRIFFHIVNNNSVIFILPFTDLRGHKIIWRAETIKYTQCNFHLEQYQKRAHKIGTFAIPGHNPHISFM